VDTWENLKKALLFGVIDKRLSLQEGGDRNRYPDLNANWMWWGSVLFQKERGFVHPHGVTFTVTSTDRGWYLNGRNLCHSPSIGKLLISYTTNLNVT
jgi:hypothetical protein